MINSHRHFSKIARRYRELRTTDLAPVLFIKNQLPKRSRIVAADVGCGAGRYDAKLFQHLGKRLFLYCVDASAAMLRELKAYLTQKGITNFKTIKSPSRKLPLKDASLDCIFTFNAIHHFNLPGFLNESCRTLKEGGKLFIYTRLRSQNKRNIWGKYFPLFCEKETRLYELKELKDSLKRCRG